MTVKEILQETQDKLINELAEALNLTSERSRKTLMKYVKTIIEIEQAKHD